MVDMEDSKDIQELDLTDCVFERDEKEGLIPIADTLMFDNNKKLNIKFKPVTRSQYYTLQNRFKHGKEKEKDIDRSIILNNLCEPSFTEKQVDDMKPIIFTTIITRIMSRSFGVTEKTYNDAEDKTQLDEIQKKN